MQSSHALTVVDVAFDDPNLIADAGLVPVMALAERIGLPRLVADQVSISDAANGAGANPGAKVMTLLAAMVAGADSIEDVDRLRHAGNGLLFKEVRAPSTLGTFLRALTHGHVQQLNRVLRDSLVELCRQVDLLPGGQQVVFVDLDSTHRQVYGYAKQGAANGRLKGKKTLHPLIATISTPIARPVVTGIRLRKGRSADVRGAARFLAETLTVLRRIAPHAAVVVRADSQFYSADIVATAARYDAAVSLTTGSNPSINAAITTIPDQAWTAIHYPDAFVDTDTGELISDAHIAEIPYVAFTGRAKKLHVAGRLIVRRVKRLNPTALKAGQPELFSTWRHHAVFVTSGFELLQAEAQHRDHAIVEQIIADAASSALAHLPSGVFNANAAWAVLWAISHNLTRAAGTLASTFHARATTATIRAHLINIPARIARSARHVRLHLPAGWPWHAAYEGIHTAVQQPAPARA
jgi:hypothetical protein